MAGEPPVANNIVGTNRYEKEDLQEALRVLRSGGIIVYPTDTVWGIGCVQSAAFGHFAIPPNKVVPEIGLEPTTY